jgi:regulator of protease activity HflC (stomatin/prohibitin superfamily)
MIIKDKDGNLHFHYGDPAKTTPEHARSFFLPPHSEVHRLNWSGGMRRLKRDLKIDRFDRRPQFMWNEIDCRTKDNVELVLETTLFWEVTDLAQMVRKTGNLTGDVYNQIRSQFIKHAAQVTLKSFMEELHTISKAIFESDAEFYTTRGVKIHSLEVTKYTCAEKRTSEVLQQIIEETTNRLNRLSQAESENEVKMFKMQGQIEQEKLNGELLEILQQHSRTEASVAGAAEADRVAAFVDRLAKDVPKLEDRISIWNVLRKTDALSVVSKGGASLYYTPNDVNLSIKTENGAGAD